MAEIVKTRVFFGHKSVGWNILDSLRALGQAEPSLALDIMESKDTADITVPRLIHYSVGANGNPISKIDDFAAALDSGLGEKLDIALFKFCYVDFDSGSDIDAVFKHYQATMDGLKQRYPDIVFIHSTVPLVAKDVSLAQRLKNLLKLILGRKLNDYRDNFTREGLSQRIRKTYGGTDPIFDIALHESIDPEGRRSMAEANGRSFPLLHGAYTSDDGHLNPSGARRLALELIKSLEQARTRTRKP